MISLALVAYVSPELIPSQYLGPSAQSLVYQSLGGDHRRLIPPARHRELVQRLRRHAPVESRAQDAAGQLVDDHRHDEQRDDRPANIGKPAHAPLPHGNVIMPP